MFFGAILRIGKLVGALGAAASAQRIMAGVDWKNCGANWTDAVGRSRLTHAGVELTGRVARLSTIAAPADVIECANWVGGSRRAATGTEQAVTSPYWGRVIGSVRASTGADVDAAVAEAERGFEHWRALPLRERAALLGQFRRTLEAHASQVARTVALESGKTEAEAHAGLSRGLEVLDFASSVNNLDVGQSLEVSRGVRCETRREPLGVVVGITPFNFPAMVPLWMAPLALVSGNAFILKPSDKVPMSACLLAELSAEAGLPDGVFSVVHGGKETAEALVAHPSVRAVGFVGSTLVARSIYSLASSHGKRALCLGGAKNHLIVAPDADDELTARAVVDSFTGCAGQRCMAGSVLVTIGEARRVVAQVIELAEKLELGSELGALINASARDRLNLAIESAVREGAELLLDGRGKSPGGEFAGGYWLAPTVLGAVTPEMACATDELFGPVLSVIEVDDLEHALALERRSPYGNATSIFTSSGAVARRVSELSTSGMIGVNIGVPVPREPFSFGGTKASRFGHGDITGTAGLDFWTQLKKVTSKWALQADQNWMS